MYPPNFKISPTYPIGIRSVPTGLDEFFPKGERNGFTLIELLLVISIIVLIAGFVIPAAGPMLKGSQLSQSGIMLNEQLALARQRALTKNHIVEVRFYKFGDPTVPGEKASDPSSGKYRAMQCFELVTSSTSAVPVPVAIDKIQRLQQSIIIDSSDKLSSILNQPARPAQPGSQTKPSQSIPVVGTAYQYAYFQFRPDGSTDMPATIGTQNAKWFLTLHSINNNDALTTPPPNFVTIQIDPVNGKVRTYRPQ